jgi:hypothetical protein
VLETVPELASTFLALLGLTGKGRLEMAAPECVEATLFHQPDRSRYVLSLVNFQAQLPNIPIDWLPVRLRLAPEHVKAVRLARRFPIRPLRTGRWPSPCRGSRHWRWSRSRWDDLSRRYLRPAI